MSFSMYDDDATIEFVFREPVVEIAYKEFSGGEYIKLTLDDLKGNKEKSIIKNNVERIEKTKSR